MSTPRQATEIVAQGALLRVSRNCSNSCGWFRNAARQVENSARKALLLDIATSLEEFHQELERERERLGGKPEDRTSLKGAIGQIAASFVSQMARGHDSVTLKSCETSAEQLRKEFGKTLDLHLEPDTREIVIKQKHRLEQHLSHLHAAASEAELELP